MAEKNFFPLNRAILNHWLWKKKPFSKGQAWVDLLLLANYEDKKIPYKGEIITCKRGDVNLSISELASRWGWNRDTARRFLRLLESDGMVTVNATTHRTTITIENYELFNNQCVTDNATSAQPVRNQCVTSAQPADTTKKDKEGKEGKEGKEDIYISVPDALKPAFMEFADMRKKKKKPITTENTVKRILNKLDKFASCTEDKIAILNQSTDNCWTDVYELKEKNVTARPAKNKAAENLNDFYEMIGEWAGEEQ